MIIYALFLFLISIHIGICKEITVSYDEKNDIIFHDKKIYVLKHEETQKLPRILNASPHEEETLSEGKFWTYVFISFCNIMLNLVLTCFAGMVSGLTVGYLSIDDLLMELKMTTGTDEEKRQADLVLPILSKRHWL